MARRERLVPPTMEQPQYNLFHRERVEKEYASLYRDFGLGTTIWSPLASGALTGKYGKGIPRDSRLAMENYGWLRAQFEEEEGRKRIEKANRLIPVAERIGCTLAQLSLAWCLKNSRVSTVITGASRVEQVRENMKALDYVEALDPEVLEEIEGIVETRPHPEEDFRML